MHSMTHTLTLFCKTVDVDLAQFGGQREATFSSPKLLVGVVTGSLALVGVAALLVVLIVYIRTRKRDYEKIPLLADE